VRVGLIAVLAMLSVPVWAADEDWAIHGQGTVIEQYHPAFPSAYRGANSLDPVSSGRETVNFTAYAGARPWDGGEAWADLEMDQGFGLSNTLGVAAFTNGEGSKVGKAVPYLRLHRLFFRQTFDMGGESEDVPGAANQLASSRTRDNVIVTLGKFSPTDIFDNNGLAHDPMHDFLNWAMIDAGPWDYAADAWGYSYGGAVEWNTGLWSFRAGLFNLSRLPNGTELTRGFGQYQLDGEVERRYSLLGQDGKIKLLAFASRGRLGDYSDAVALATATHQTADISLVRKASWKSGMSLNLEQGLTADLSLFGRATIDDPSKEGEEFTDMANSLSLGLSLKGARWRREGDTVGLAFETGGVGKPAQRFFALGGLGILIGDGRLDHYDRENVVEAYYAASVIKGVQATLDYQFIANPAYNTDRGPVSVLGVRLHAEF
jgi:high affinity Mn2+ porin